MSSKLTVAKKLLLAFGSMFVTMLVLAYGSWSATANLGGLLNTAVHSTAAKMDLCGHLGTTLSDMLSLERGMVFRATVNDPAHVEQYQEAFAAKRILAEKDVASIRPLIVTETGRQALDVLQSNINLWQGAHEELRLALRNAKDVSTLEERANQVLLQSSAAQRGVDSFMEIQRSLNRSASEKADRQSSWANTMLIAGLVFGLVVGGVVLLVIRRVNRVLRDIAGQVTESAAQVASAATQISSASQSLAQGSSEQAASLEETSSSTAEINAMSQKNAENAQTATDLAGQVDQSVIAASHTLEQMVASMTEIGNSSDKVSKIIKVIDEIAFQTNILALNAAVEAARAGEAGMGFAVVADEVRNLAQRCAQAAKDTASLIEESLSKSRDGIDKLDKVAAAIQSITGSAAKSKTLVAEVHLGSQEQARGIEQIAHAIAQMEQVTQKNAANAEESASASQELSAQAESMRSAAGGLQALVGGAEDRSALAPHRPPAVARNAPAPQNAGMRHSLSALNSAVARKNNAPVSASLVSAGKPDPDMLPLDEDFKDF